MLEAYTSTNPRFDHLPSVYPRKYTFSSVAECALSMSWPLLLDVAYLIPEYKALRETVVDMQWINNSDDGSEYIVSLNIPRRSFKSIVSHGLGEKDRFEIFFQRPPQNPRTKKQKRQMRGWPAVIIGDNIRHPGTHLALVRRGKIFVDVTEPESSHSPTGNKVKTHGSNSLMAAETSPHERRARGATALQQRKKQVLVTDRRHIRTVDRFHVGGLQHPAYVGAMETFTTVKGRVKSIAKVSGLHESRSSQLLKERLVKV